MTNQLFSRAETRSNEQTGQFVRCPVCDQLLDLRDLDEILLHAHELKFESAAEDAAPGGGS
jgi:hypothetical protein